MLGTGGAAFAFDDFGFADFLDCSVGGVCGCEGCLWSGRGGEVFEEGGSFGGGGVGVGHGGGVVVLWSVGGMK